MTSNAWNALGSGLNDIVYAIAINGTDIYVGGQFTDAGGDLNADYIAKWDGTSWSSLGAGLNGQVSVLAFNGSTLYVGGTFTDAGGDANADYVAQWDGSTWSAFGNGLNARVNDISVTGSDIYIAGNFTNAGVDPNADYIAKMDGGTWAALGSNPLNGWVNTMYVAGATVYAGGQFLNTFGNPNIRYIAQWDGTSWSALGTGLDGSVSAITMFNGELYAGGQFFDAGGNANADKIAKWDGSSWSAVGNGLSSYVSNFAVSGESLYATGNFLNAGGDANADYIARWNGSSWSALGATPLNGAVTAIAADGLDLYVGGDFTDAGGNTSSDRIARFETDTSAPTVTSFSALSPSPSIDIPITAFAATDDAAVAGYLINESDTPPASDDAGWKTSAPAAYTVGSDGVYTLYPWVKDTSGNVSALYGSPLAVSVDTTPPTIYTNTWNPLGSGLSNITYDLALSGTDVVAVGSFLDAGGYSNGDRAAKWNGTSWSPMGSGLNAQTETVMVDGSIIYAGGNFSNAGGNASANNIAQWNGSNWSAVGTGLNGTVSDIAVSGSNVYATGLFTNASGNANADYVARWNGSSWSALGTTPLPPSANVVAIDGSDVYVGGSFQDVGGDANADFIARWNGSSWSALGSGLNLTVSKIILSNGDLYAGGTFTDAGGNASADRIAKWNGTSWSPLGSGLNGTVYVIAAQGTDIYAGGNFTDAGGDTNADYIAKWNGSSWSALGSTPLNGTVYSILIDGAKIYASGSFTDAGGNSNADRIAMFVLDTSTPAVVSFTVPSISTSLQVPITEFTASDDSAVTGYRITESDAPPSAGTAGWTTSAPTSYTVGGDGSYTLYPWVKDASGNVSPVYGSPAGVTVDSTKPTVTSFSAPSASASLNVQIAAFGASDNVAVTGFLITESSAPPSPGAAGWTASAPTTYTVASQGTHTLYPWVKDALDNVSVVYGSPVSVTVDVTKPTVNSFMVTSASSSLNVPITAFTASDNIAVSGYLITESSTPPSAGAAGWNAFAPTTFTVAGQGSHTLYPWVKDAAGNVSNVYGSPSTVSVDTAAPTVTAFSAPATSNSFAISISNFTATDGAGVTGYLITESSTPPSVGAAGWTASAPGTYTVGVDGSYTLYPWAKDAAGNVSTAYGSPASVVVDTSVDSLSPTVDVFTVASSSASLEIPITTFTASDNVAVISYLITESATPPPADDAGWSASAPTTYAVAGDGSYSLYPWAKDAAGNVSSVYGSPVNVTVDTTAPTVLSSVRADANPTAAASVDYTVTFSESVTGVDETDFSLWTSGGSDAFVTAVSGSGATYNVSVFTGVASATFRLDVLDDDSIQDSVGNALAGNFTSGESYTYDIDLPGVVSSARANANPTGAASVDFTVTFSESVTGVDVSDFNLSTTGVTGASIASVTVGPIAYTVTVNTGSGNGTIRLDVQDDDSILDVINNPLAGLGHDNGDFASGEEYTIVKSAVIPGVPTLLSPANAALTGSTQPLLDWNNSSPAAHHYQIQIATNNIFTAPVVNESNVSTSEFTPATPLIPGKLYYWRVKAFNVINGASGWSAVRNFKTPLAQPTPGSPIAGVSLVKARTSFGWSSVDGATQYTLQVSTVSNFSTLLVNVNVNTNEYDMSTDLPQDKTLYWRLSAKTSAVTGPWSVTESFKTGNPPTVPVLVAPANNMLVTNYRPLLNWNNSTVPAGTTFSHYILEVDDDSNFSSPVIPATPAVSEHPIDYDLAPNTKYYWHVAAVNTVGGMEHFSAWSTVWSFRTVIDAAALQLPSADDHVLTLRPYFDWDVPSGQGAVTGYTIQISKNNTFSQIVHTGNPVPSEYIPGADLPKGLTLYWRVQTKGANGPSAWSTPRAFLSANSPTTPTLSLPAQNTLNTNYLPLLKWSAVTLPLGTTFDHYQVQVDDDINFGSTAVDDVSVTDRLMAQFQTVSPLAPNTTYYWRVRAFNTVGEVSNWSTVRYFRTLLAVPSGLNVIATANPLRPILDWENATGTGTISGYAIQVSTSASFNSLLVNSTTVSSGYSVMRDLPVGITIYWRVRVNGANGPSAWSTAQFVIDE